MNTFISNRAIKRLTLLFVSALAGLLGAALLVVVARPTQAQGAANIDAIVILVSPPTLTADGVSTALITVTVLSNTMPISNVTLSGLLLPTSLGGITPFSPTDSLGHAFSSWTAGTVAGSGELIVGDGGFTRTANIALTAGSLVTITVSPNPATVTAGMTRTFTAAGVDQHSNPVPITPTWTTNGGTIGASGVFTAQTGVATGRLVTATQDGISSTAIVNLVQGPLVTITASPDPATVTVGMTQTFTAAGVDQHSNPVPITPAWTTNGGTIDASGLFTAQTGVATGRLVTATQDGVSSTATVNLVQGPLVTITVSPNPATVTVGMTRTFTAAGVDQLYNPVPITPTWTTNGGTIGASGVFTAQTGIATGRLVTATQDGISSTATVNLVQGPLVTITVSPNPATVTVGMTRTFTAAGVDQHSNPVPITPAWTTNGGTIGASGVFTAQTGVATGRLVTATQDGISGTATVNLVVGIPTTITLQVTPATLIVNSNQTSSITATVVDLYGNRVPNVSLNGNLSPPTLGTVTAFSPTNSSGQAFGTWTAGSSIGPGSLTVTSGSITGTAVITLAVGQPYTVTLYPDPPSLVVGNPSSLLAIVTDQFGNQVANGTLVTFTSSIGSFSPPVRTTQAGAASSSLNSTQAGVAFITVTSASAQGTITVTFAPDVPATLALQASPASLVVGHSSVLTATVRDRYNNAVVNGIPVTFTSDLGNVVSPVTTTNGAATSSVTSTLAGTAHITATTGGTVSNTTSVTFLPSTTFFLNLQVAPAVQVVGNNSILTATVTDQFGNSVANGTLVTITRDLGNVISPVTTTNGIATSAISATQVGTAHITATSGLGQDTGSVTFVPGAPFSLTLQAQPVSQTVGLSSTLTATVYDRFHNLVANNTSVTLTKDLPGTIRSPVTTTSGIATSQVTITLANVAHITATSGAASKATVVTFTPGTATTITVQVNPPNLIANSGLTATIIATVVDRFNNPVPRAPLTGTVPSALGTVSGLGATNADGQAFGAWTAGSTVGNGLLSVTNGAITGTSSIALLLSNPQTVTVQVISPTLVANSGMTTTVIATVRDAFGNFIPNAALNFSLAPLALGSIVSPSVTTDGNGNAYTIWAAGSVVTRGLMIASATITATGSAAITLTADVPYTVTLQANPTSPVVGVGSALTATVTDRFFNPVINGTVVTFTSNFGSVLSPMTTTNGQAFSHINWTLVGTVRITATSGLAKGTTTVNFVPDVPYTLSLQVNPPSRVVGGSSVLTATVRDRYNNLVANNTLVTMASNLGVVSPSSGTTANGRVTSSISSTQAGVATITATSGLAQRAATVTFAPDVPATLVLQANPTLQVVGNSSALTATVRDKYSNLVAGGTLVTFTTSLGQVVSPRTTTNGIATTFISATLAGTAHITATSGVAQGTKLVNFKPDAPATLALQTVPSSLVVGHSSVLTALVRDRFSNPVENGTLVTITTDLGNVASPVTTTNGIATSSVSSTRSGPAHVVAKSKSAQNTKTVTFLPGLAATTTVQLGTNTLLVNTPTSTGITVTVVDLYGNRVPDWPLSSYFSPTTLGSLTWQSPTTDLNGQAFGRWWAGTVYGNGALVVNGASTPVRLAPRLTFLPVMMRGFPPTPTGTWVKINAGAANTYRITVTLQVSATVPADYIEWMRFSNDGAEWGNWVTFAPTATWNLDLSNGLKTVYAQFIGHAGGVSAVISDDILLFKNGDFTQPNLASWNRYPGSVLNVSTAPEPGNPSNPSGLLGSPTYACNNVPIGFGRLTQELIMPDVEAGQQLALRLNYHIYTSDRNFGLLLDLDRFEVLLDNTRVFSDMNQDINKPPNPPYDPPNTPPPPAVCTVYDLGSREATILITGNPGNPINVVLSLYNLPDQYYNTYVYVDNVRLELQGRSSKLSDPVPSPPDAPGEHTGR